MARSAVVSDDVLDETPGRAFKFLGAVGSRVEIRAHLASKGYSEEDHQRGWKLVLDLSGYRQPDAPVATTPEAASAIATIDAWDEPNFRIARAALAEFPEQLAFVFDGLEAQTGAAAVGSVSTFLNRLDELEGGKERKGSRKDDHAALVKLAARGITKDERTRLRGLLDVALSSPDPAPAAAAPKNAKAVEKQRAAKLALYAWYAEWAEIAKVVIKRRDYLIQMGLATRKTKKAAPAPATNAPGTGGSS